MSAKDRGTRLYRADTPKDQPRLGQAQTQTETQVLLESPFELPSLHLHLFRRSPLSRSLTPFRSPFDSLRLFSTVRFNQFPVLPHGGGDNDDISFLVFLS
ncbi:Uncharacterized protein HZ326_11956 [Fusarium oxysporum f. sp. albedinis]|nr:Uncharacterized protein HZ326_11956 [Fusarium oxysporum f. sp. albedinis]